MKAKAVVFGCGMGDYDETIAFTKSMLDIAGETETLAVFDAAHPNALSHIPEWWRTTATLGPTATWRHGPS